MVLTGFAWTIVALVVVMAIAGRFLGVYMVAVYVALLVSYLISRLQGLLPFSPQHLPVSFVANTNWQPEGVRTARVPRPQRRQEKT